MTALHSTRINNVCGVLVSYNPDPIELKNNIALILNQVDQLIVVDNGSNPDIRTQLANLANPNITLLDLGENTGVANAYNVGINKALALGFDFALLLDQDSLPEKNMVSHLLSVLTNDVTKKSVLAGPVYKRESDLTGSFFVDVKPNKVSRIYPEDTTEQKIECSMLISSGSLLRLSLWQQVGEYREDLFIDHVDTEWCFRAAAKGFHLYGVPKALLFHSLGDNSVRMWLFRWRQIPIHDPIRNYYTVRNSLRLYKMKHVPSVWVKHDVIRLIMLMLFSITLCDKKIKRLKMIVIGSYDGILEKTALPWGKKNMAKEL